MLQEKDDSPRERRVWMLIATAAVILLPMTFWLGHERPFEKSAAPPTSSVEVRPSPNVIVAVRELARLETSEYHIERVIELADEQSRLFGLLHVKDAMLLVAAGDVVAGVDLSTLQPSDIEVDWPARKVRMRLPPPQIFTTALDNARTHVVERKTDTLAMRSEKLEGLARAEAEASMRTAAIDAGVLDRAKASAQRSVRELLHGLGFEQIELQ